MNAQSLDQELERLLERFNANPEGRFFAPLADCYRKLGRLAEALRVCESGLARHPDYSSALVILGRIQFDRGDLEAAEDAFRRVLEMDPQNLVALRQLARAAEARGDLEACRDGWTRVAALEPRAADAKEQLERLEHLERETPSAPGSSEAETVADTADVGTADVSAPDASAAETDAVEDVEAAVAATSELEDEDPLAPTQDQSADATSAESPKAPGSERASQIATMTLADIYYEQGFKAKALEIYRTVLRDSPQTPGIAQKVERIEAELVQIQGRLGPGAGLPSQPSLAELESSDYGDGVLSAGIADEVVAAEEEGLMSPRPAGPERKGSPDPLDDDGDFDHFRTWLGRIKARPL